MSTREAFWPDDEYDKQPFSTHESRYGAYLYRYRSAFQNEDGDLVHSPAEFAAAAWRVANSPLMEPPYTAHHPRIQSTRPEWDPNHFLAISVDLALPARSVIAHLPGQWRGWACDELTGQLIDVEDNTWHTALPSLIVRVPLQNDATVPQPAFDGEIPDTATAKQAVYAVCHALNAALNDLLANLDGWTVNR